MGDKINFTLGYDTEKLRDLVERRFSELYIAPMCVELRDNLRAQLKLALNEEVTSFRNMVRSQLQKAVLEGSAEVVESLLAVHREELQARTDRWVVENADETIKRMGEKALQRAQEKLVKRAERR